MTSSRRLICTSRPSRITVGRASLNNDSFAKVRALRYSWIVPIRVLKTMTNPNSASCHGATIIIAIPQRPDQRVERRERIAADDAAQAAAAGVADVVHLARRHAGADLVAGQARVGQGRLDASTVIAGGWLSGVSPVELAGRRRMVRCVIADPMLMATRLECSSALPVATGVSWKVVLRG